MYIYIMIKILNGIAGCQQKQADSLIVLTQDK